MYGYRKAKRIVSNATQVIPLPSLTTRPQHGHLLTENLEGGVTVSNNSTKRRQNGFKIGTRDKFATDLR